MKYMSKNCAKDLSALDEVVVTAPPYAQQRGWMPRNPEDFGDGGASSEIHVTQDLQDLRLAEMSAAERIHWQKVEEKFKKLAKRIYIYDRKVQENIEWHEKFRKSRGIGGSSRPEA